MLSKLILNDYFKSNKVLIIPEIGINHNGSLKVAKQMVLAAKKAGAIIIKHQTHIIESEMTIDAKKTIPGHSKKSIYEIMKECALSEKDERELKKYTESLGMIFMSTPFSKAAADRLHKMNVKIYKIGSGEMNNFPLLDYVASFGKPMIVSTGMNSLEDVKKAVCIIRKRKIPFALLHTTNLYPTKPNQVRLGAMQEMMKTFKDIPIGLSDHSINNNAAFAAIALGAKVIERHFTDTKKRKGIDINCSMDEKELKELIAASKEIPSMLGGKKKPLKEEKITMNFAFASVCSIKPIKKGEKFTKDNIWIKRPGNGEIHARDYYKVLGKTARQNIKEGVQLKKCMIKNA